MLVQAVHLQVHWQLFILERASVQVRIWVGLRLVLEAAVESSFHPPLDPTFQQISPLLVPLVRPLLSWTEHLVREFIID